MNHQFQDFLSIRPYQREGFYASQAEDDEDSGSYSAMCFYDCTIALRSSLLISTFISLSSFISSWGYTPRVYGNLLDRNPLTADKTAKMIMMRNPLLMQVSMMMGATVTVTPPMVATSPVPKTLI